jgi:endonuclease YncB( thermonuclease family)
MVVNGWAWVMEQYAFEREEAYCAAQDDARREKRGLWAMDNPEPPWRFKQKEKRRRLVAERQPNLKF